MLQILFCCHPQLWVPWQGLSVEPLFLTDRRDRLLRRGRGGNVRSEGRVPASLSRSQRWCQVVRTCSLFSGHNRKDRRFDWWRRYCANAVGKLCARSSHAVVLRTLYLAPIIKRFSTTFKFLNTQVVFMYGTPRKILVLTVITFNPLAWFCARTCCVWKRPRHENLYAWASERGGTRPPWILKILAKKGCFLSFEWAKNKFHHFRHPLQKVRKNPPVHPSGKKSFHGHACMYFMWHTGSCDTPAHVTHRQRRCC